MRWYVDTNIILDLILRREPHLETASAIFNFSTTERLSLFTCSHSIPTAHYVAKKSFKEDVLRNVIDEILNFLNIVAVDEDILRKSLKSAHKDFEDAIHILCAHQIKNLDGIITRNMRDFSTSEIKVFSPDEAVAYINKKIKQ